MCGNKNRFSEALECVVGEERRGRMVVVVVGDFNTRVGHQEEGEERVVGRFV